MILITGATGFIGHHLVDRLTRTNQRVRCLLSETELSHAQWEIMPEIAEGTLMDIEELFRATTGVHTIIHLKSAQWWGTSRDLELVEVVGTQNLMEAARAARVGRVITLSHLGATAASAYPLMRIKGSVEEIIRTGGLAYTIIRSGPVFGKDDAFFNHIAMMLNLNPVLFLMPGRGEVVVHPIYIEDIVTVIAQSLENIDTVDKVIEIGGPEYITLRDLIRTIMRVSGTYRIVVPVPPYFLRWLNGITRLFLPRGLMTPQWLDLLATNRTASIGTLARYFDLQPHRLEDTMLTYMRGHNDFFSAVRYLFRRRPRISN